MILPTTVKATEGLCMPCRNRYPRRGSSGEKENATPKECDLGVLVGNLTFELRSLAGCYWAIPRLIQLSQEKAESVPAAIEQIHDESSQVAQRLGVLGVLTTAQSGTDVASGDAPELLRSVGEEFDRVLDLLAEVRRKCETPLSDGSTVLGASIHLTAQQIQELTQRLRHLRTWLSGRVSS